MYLPLCLETHWKFTLQFLFNIYYDSKECKLILVITIIIEILIDIF